MRHLTKCTIAAVVALSVLGAAAHFRKPSPPHHQQQVCVHTSVLVQPYSIEVDGETYVGSTNVTTCDTWESK